jgi:hypothetical protein
MVRLEKSPPQVVAILGAVAQASGAFAQAI